MLRFRTSNAKQGKNALQNNEHGNAHDQRQNGDDRPASVPPQIQPRIIPLKSSYFSVFTILPPDFCAHLSTYCHNRRHFRCKMRSRCRRQKSEDKRNDRSSQKITPFSGAVFIDQQPKLPHILCQKQFRRQLIQCRRQNTFGRQNARQHTCRNPKGT